MFTCSDQTTATRQVTDDARLLAAATIYVHGTSGMTPQKAASLAAEIEKALDGYVWCVCEDTPVEGGHWHRQSAPSAISITDQEPA